ncbi:hypothetical protein PaG_05290 [Moesziomyces aphidis]|uniref:JmjC domain-containing protein n=1 Tax=Moesziomyces aphidis TaxID=84754 RepID=W3VIR6_MOEAP|nr:hypothetical protein PaG_05290 [Moesziomyces aphidis]
MAHLSFELPARSNSLLRDWVVNAYGTPNFENGLTIIKWAESKRDKVTGVFVPEPPFEHNGLDRIFTNRPQFRHAIAELLGNRDVLNIFGANFLLRDPDKSLLDFLDAAFKPAVREYDRTHEPLMAVVTTPGAVDGGLKDCLPKEPSFNMFRRIRCLSPHVSFSTASDVFVNTSGTFSPMHIDIGMTSGFSTMIDGAKLFVLYGCNDHNRRIMQRCHLHPVDWSGALRLMRELTEPRLVYLKPGDTIYVGAGQPHFVLSPKPGALVTLNCANPSISEWDNTLKGYDSLITGICNYLSVQGLSQLEVGGRCLRQEAGGRTHEGPRDLQAAWWHKVF